MKHLTRAQEKRVVAQWKRAAPALARVRREELASWQYDPATVDALLDIGANAACRHPGTSGLVEMQRWFIKAARRQGLLPAAVRERAAPYAAAPLRVFGGAALPPGPFLALFGSVRCPGALLLEACELADRWRAAGFSVIGGFHAPLERECLRRLLPGPGPVVWCLARGLPHRVPAAPVDCRAAVAAGRLAIAAPFPDAVRRATARTALARNRRVAGLAAAVIVAYAAPGSRLEALAFEWLAAGKPLYTFDHPAHAALLRAGARTITKDTDWRRALDADAAPAP